MPRWRPVRRFHATGISPLMGLIQLRWESWRAIARTVLERTILCWTAKDPPERRLFNDPALRAIPFAVKMRFGLPLAKAVVRPVNWMQETRRRTVTLVLGGVRSGKSRYAQQLGEQVERVLFVATAPAASSDAEMRRKIERHQADRPAAWRTVEEPLEVARVLQEQGPGCDLAIVDCLTLFVANLLHAAGEDDAILQQMLEQQLAALCAALAAAPCDVVLVSNEVGSGVVPAYASGRQFRDALGELNQRVAAVADDVLLLVAGLPLALKGEVAARKPAAVQTGVQTAEQAGVRDGAWA
jgi:adenosylcobinamide kinase/adenosylcobinamide-phosphate guanylyltransferase